MEQDDHRLIIDLDPELRRRLEVAAEREGVSMKRYCQAAIDRVLAQDEANGPAKRGFNREAFERLVELRQEIFRGKPLPGNSADYIREAREERSKQMDGAIGSSPRKPDHELFAELRQEIFRGKPLPGNSADYIREAREIRGKDMDRW